MSLFVGQRVERAAQPGLDTAQWQRLGVAQQWLSDGSAMARHGSAMARHGLAVARQWLGDGLAVVLVQHVPVATRGWCCLAEAPLQTGWHRSATVPSLRSQPDWQPSWAHQLPHPRQGSADNLMCITDLPQDSFVAAGLSAHASPRLCTGTSRVQMCLTGVGRGSDSPEKAAVSQEAPASHSPGEQSWPGSSIKPLPLPWAQVLLQAWTWLQ